jgi:hypothetical protein
MSYTRTAIAITIIVTTLSAGHPGTQPEAASEGLAGSEILGDAVLPQRQTLQAPDLDVASIEQPATTAVHAETREQSDTANWALDQMAAAGFELPPVTIYMHSDRADCSSDPNRVLNGYYVQIDGENIVHSCGNEWTLLHELTHVWDKNVLDDKTRDQIMDHQGLDSWMSDTWNHAGGEHLASIVAWAIEGTHPTRIGYYDRQHLAEAYAMVTGDEPPMMATPDGIETAASSTSSVETSPVPAPDKI